MKEDNFCVLPWIHVAVRPDSQLWPCCRYMANGDMDRDIQRFYMDDLKNDGIEAMNNPYWTKLRSDMLEGNHRRECRKCQGEERSKYSMRMRFNEKFSFINRDTVTEKFEKMRYIEMSLDNICNLECRICISRFSSRLQKRDGLFGNPVFKKEEPTYNSLDKVDLSELEKIKLLGGEPFITPNFEPFIDYIIERADPSKILLEIATNGTKLPSGTLLEKLKLFKELEIHVSIDGVDNMNEYQRHGSSTEAVWDNFYKLREMFPNAFMAIHTVISVYNAPTIWKLFERVHNESIPLSFDIMREPEYQSLFYADPDYVEEILDLNKQNARCHELMSRFLEEHRYDEYWWNQLNDFTRVSDELHGTRLEDYNPILWRYLK